MKQLTKTQEKKVQHTYRTFSYLIDAVSYDIKDAYRFFKQDRNLTKRELELIILNYLYLYETKLKDLSLQSQIGNDFGLLGLMAAFERIRGCSGFDKLSRQMEGIREIYLTTIEE